MEFREIITTFGEDFKNLLRHYAKYLKAYLAPYVNRLSFNTENIEKSSTKLQ